MSKVSSKQARTISSDDSKAQSLITFMLDNQIQSLTPRVEFGKGLVYSEIAPLFKGKKTSEVESYLSDLAREGFLEKHLVDRIVSCPSCAGTDVDSKYQCDRCKSFNISYVEILLHPLCGYSGSKSNFLPSNQGADYVQCPKCRRVISTSSKKEISSLGKIFECNSCNNRFDAPKIVHECKGCGTFFTYNEAAYSPVYKYTLSSRSTEGFLSGRFSLPAISEWFRNEGFTVETSKELIGKSGTVHRFDIVLSVGTMKNLLLGDFSLSLDEKKILVSFAKRYDVNPRAKSFVITHNKTTKAIENLSNLYDISIIYMDSIGTSPSLEEQLRRMLGGIPQIVPHERMGMTTVEDIDERDPAIIKEEQKQVERKRVGRNTESHGFYFQNDSQGNGEEGGDDDDDVYLVNDDKDA